MRVKIEIVCDVEEMTHEQFEKLVEKIIYPEELLDTIKFVTLE